jgi:DNA-binding transcriptional ArsR family regulator
MTPDLTNDQLTTTFAALADPTRRAILARLASGETSVTELAEPFEMSLPAISKHLKVLERAGLLERQIDGRVHHCRLDPKAMQDASMWIEEQRRFWEAAFSRLDEYFARNPERNDKP